MRYKSDENYSHGDERKIGVLLVNLGTPDAPTTSAVRKYLSEFLSDPRIIDIPKIIWWFILNLIILNIRPKKSKELYKKIWMEDGSPLLVISKEILKKIQNLSKDFNEKSVVFNLAMRYGNPSIRKVLDDFKNQNINKLLVVPMFPQYSAATTASIFDKISDEIKQWRNIPDIRFLSTYHDNPHYIAACANRITDFWHIESKSQKLIFSFHGLPHVNLHRGDPYHCYCHKTARLIAEKLKINEDQYVVTFQSRFGKQVWLQPYIDEVLENLVNDGINNVDVFCPGFLCDCLETLEEINIQSRENYMSCGGKSFNYIPALNSSDYNIESMLKIIEQEIMGWDNSPINSQENLLKTKDLFEKHQFNKKS